MIICHDSELPIPPGHSCAMIERASRAVVLETLRVDDGRHFDLLELRIGNRAQLPPNVVAIPLGRCESPADVRLFFPWPFETVELQMDLYMVVQNKSDQERRFRCEWGCRSVERALVRDPLDMSTSVIEPMNEATADEIVRQMRQTDAGRNLYEISQPSAVSLAPARQGPIERSTRTAAAFAWDPYGESEDS